MKAILYLVFIVALVSAYNRDDAVKIASGLIEGLELNEPKNKLTECVDKMLWTAWEETVPKARLILGDNIANLHEALMYFLRGPMESVTFMRACSETDMVRMIQIMSMITDNRAKFEENIKTYRQEIMDLMMQFFAVWDESYYVDVGIKAAKIVNLVFKL